MAKHRKNAGKAERKEAAGGKPALALEAAKPALHPPRRRPVLLAVSIVLFALWFAFLLLTALSSARH